MTIIQYGSYNKKFERMDLSTKITIQVTNGGEGDSPGHGEGFQAVP
jgi:hypothetical protein